MRPGENVQIRLYGYTIWINGKYVKNPPARGRVLRILCGHVIFQADDVGGLPDDGYLDWPPFFISLDDLKRGGYSIQEE